MPRTVAVLQSNYLPWKGYFDLIHDVDLFVFYDDVQYTKNDWRNRNRVKSGRGLRWLTVPVGAHIGRKVCEVEIRDRAWPQKHWKTLRQNYSRAPHFASHAGFFEEMLLGRVWNNLSELNQAFIRRIAGELLGIRTEFADSREYVLTGQRQERLLSLLTALKAQVYVSGPAARAYIEEAVFARAGIDVHYKSYQGYPEYRQLYPPFIHEVSIVDAIFHLGSAASDFIWGWRRSGRG
ncbi:MAG TPA: WbqC family protein [Burkholderiales bacterium]|nr:WbqC family protein [Burkholderiales bacterium]